MAHFLKGKYKAFHQVGPSECVRDIFRFRQYKETSLQMELTRRDMETYAGRFWRYENAYISLFPVDESQPRLGGKVRVKALTVDWRTFTFRLRTLHGIYSDDFITFGEFDKASIQGEDPFHNEAKKSQQYKSKIDEALLLKVVDEEDRTTVPDRHTFKFENNALHYKREVNSETRDTEIEHPVSENKLSPLIDQTWSEVFFYGLANKRV